VDGKQVGWKVVWGEGGMKGVVMLRLPKTGERVRGGVGKKKKKSPGKNLKPRRSKRACTLTWVREH